MLSSLLFSVHLDLPSESASDHVAAVDEAGKPLVCSECAVASSSPPPLQRFLFRSLKIATTVLRWALPVEPLLGSPFDGEEEEWLLDSPSTIPLCLPVQLGANLVKVILFHLIIARLLEINKDRLTCSHHQHHPSDMSVRYGPYCWPKSSSRAKQQHQPKPSATEFMRGKEAGEACCSASACPLAVPPKCCLFHVAEFLKQIDDNASGVGSRGAGAGLATSKAVERKITACSGGSFHHISNATSTPGIAGSRCSSTPTHHHTPHTEDEMMSAESSRSSLLSKPVEDPRTATLLTTLNARRNLQSAAVEGAPVESSSAPLRSISMPSFAAPKGEGAFASSVLPVGGTLYQSAADRRVGDFRVCVGGSGGPRRTATLATSIDGEEREASSFTFVGWGSEAAKDESSEKTSSRTPTPPAAPSSRVSTSSPAQGGEGRVVAGTLSSAASSPAPGATHLVALGQLSGEMAKALCNQDHESIPTDSHPTTTFFTIGGPSVSDTDSECEEMAASPNKQPFAGFEAPLPRSEPPFQGPDLRGVPGKLPNMVIGAFLGGGACGRVYECLDRRTGEMLAVKQIVFAAGDPRIRARLQQLAVELEVMHLSPPRMDAGERQGRTAHEPERFVPGLNPSGIVRLHCVEKRGCSVLIYMEYCSGGSLLDYVLGSAASDSPSSARPLPEQVLDGGSPTKRSRLECRVDEQSEAGELNASSLNCLEGKPLESASAAACPSRVGGGAFHSIHESDAAAALTDVKPVIQPPISSTLPPLLPLQVVRRFLYQITSGLAFLHEHGYAHLDMKTANVLLTRHLDCRLADFGCAARVVRSASPAASFPVVADHEALSELRGTALYMAPEMIRLERHSIGTPADVWALGCVAMELATGLAPWRHISNGKLRVLFVVGSAKAALPLPPVLLERASAQVPIAEWDSDDSMASQDDFSGESYDHLVDLVSQCLQLNPGDRPTAEAVLAHPFFEGPL